MITMSDMAKAKRDTGDRRKGDRHKPGRQIRVRQALLSALDALAERNATSPPEETNRAIRELLEREGFWPPKSSS